MTRLGGTALRRLPPTIAVPAYDPAGLKCGIVHLGLGAFHRAHQALFTDSAIAAAGGDWGITAVSLRTREAPDALTAQDGLYTVEFLAEAPACQVVGSIRAALFAPGEPRAVLAALAAPTTHIVTLTVTEAGYGPDDGADPPRSTVGWLTRGLAERRRADAGPLTGIISCDNLRGNGARLEGGRSWSWPTAWIQPCRPGSPPTLRSPPPWSTASCPPPIPPIAPGWPAALGVTDVASVQREAFRPVGDRGPFRWPAPRLGPRGSRVRRQRRRP